MRALPPIKKGKTIPIDVLNHNFDKMKAWLWTCANHWEGGWTAKVSLFQVYKMVVYLQKLQDKIDDVIIKAFATKEG